MSLIGTGVRPVDALKAAVETSGISQMLKDPGAKVEPSNGRTRIAGEGGKSGPVNAFLKVFIRRHYRL